MKLKSRDLLFTSIEGSFRFQCIILIGTLAIRKDVSLNNWTIVVNDGQTLLTRAEVFCSTLTHWGRVTHICVSKVTIIGSDNDLKPGRRQVTIWINGGILLIGPFGTNFSKISFEIFTFSLKKLHLKMSSGKWRPSFLGFNVLSHS